MRMPLAISAVALALAGSVFAAPQVGDKKDGIAFNKDGIGFNNKAIHDRVELPNGFAFKGDPFDFKPGKDFHPTPSDMPPAPEPHPSALMLAALAAVSLVALRRRPKQS